VAVPFTKVLEAEFLYKPIAIEAAIRQTFIKDAKNKNLMSTVICSPAMDFEDLRVGCTK
jgi:hypothetical protein